MKNKIKEEIKKGLVIGLVTQIIAYLTLLLIINVSYYNSDCWLDVKRGVG